MKVIFGLFAFVFFNLFIFNLLIWIPEVIGEFLFNIFGLDYSSFAIWLLLIFGSLSILFFYASRESFRDYLVKREVYKAFEKYLG